MTSNYSTEFTELLSKFIESIEESISLMKDNLTDKEYRESEIVTKSFLEVAILACIHKLSSNEREVLQLMQQFNTDIVITKFLDLGICITEVNQIIDSFVKRKLLEKSTKNAFRKNIGSPPNTIISKGKYFDVLMKQMNNSNKS